MHMFEDEEVKISIESKSNGEICGKEYPIIKLYKELTKKHPKQYCHLETFPIDMVRAMLKYLVYYRGLDGRKARKFEEKYLDPALNGANIKRTLYNMGEEKFDEMIIELYKLAAPYNKSE